MYKDFRGKIEAIDTKLANLQNAEDNYYLTTNYVLQLANRAYDLFVSSEMEQKRQLLKLILQNPTLEGRKVRYNVLKPFDTLLNCSDHQLWLPDSRRLRITISTILKAFEDLVQVELLKVRWEEIKRLQVQPIPEPKKIYLSH